MRLFVYTRFCPDTQPMGQLFKQATLWRMAVQEEAL
jgi:hypothetical protein